jgi:hypothetical protein
MSNRDDSNFFSEEEYDENFDEGDEDANDEDAKDFINKNEVLYTMELDHLDNRLHKETNVAVMKEAVKLAKDTLLWRFRTKTNKLKIILGFYYDIIPHVNFDKSDIE